MGIPAKPLYEPSLSELTLSYADASRYLGKEIILYYRGEGDAVHFVTTDLREIYKRWQRSLAESFELSEFSIKGGSVSHLFSEEPFSDIDFHATINLAEKKQSPQKVFETGNTVTAKLLETIAKIISEKLTCLAQSAVSIAPQAVLFEGKHIPFSKWGNPYNIHQLYLKGSPQ